MNSLGKIIYNFVIPHPCLVRQAGLPNFARGEICTPLSLLGEGLPIFQAPRILDGVRVTLSSLVEEQGEVVKKGLTKRH